MQQNTSVFLWKDIKMIGQNKAANQDYKDVILQLWLAGI